MLNRDYLLESFFCFRYPINLRKKCKDPLIVEPKGSERSGSMAGTFCVTVTHCRTDKDKATLAFVVANAALGSEKDTMVFLSTDGVWCAVKGEAEKISVGAPFAPLKELIDKFLAGGGKILVCNPCMKLRSITEDQLIQGATPAGGAALVEWLSNGSPSVAY
jgi:predicted peroxiredoxin